MSNPEPFSLSIGNIKRFEDARIINQKLAKDCLKSLQKIKEKSQNKS